MKIHPDILACHAQFGGDLKDMQRRYDAACEACDGSGVEVFGITVYEHGCGFSHDSTDERPCRICDGTGLPERKYEPDSPPYPVKMNEGDLPF